MRKVLKAMGFKQKGDSFIFMNGSVGHGVSNKQEKASYQSIKKKQGVDEARKYLYRNIKRG